MDMKNRIFQSITLVAMTGLLVIAHPTTVHAQGDITGAVAVTIADEQGGALPGVALRLTNDAITLSGTTDVAGQYRFQLVPAGMYLLRADLPGFAPTGMDNIKVEFGTTYTAKLVLRGEEFAGEVTVTAAPPQIDTTIPTTKDSMTSEFIQEMPLRNRNFEELVNLLPGVSDSMVQGSRTTATGYRIDGASNVDPYNSGVAITFSQSAIDRFELVPNGFEARYGEFSGGVVNVTTRSGTNDFVGHLGYFFRDDSFVSNPPIEYPDQEHDKAPDTRRFLEGAIGGAITPDTLHYFATLEYRYSDVGDVFAVRTSETDSYLGSFKLNWLQSNQDQWTVFTAFNLDDTTNLVANRFVAPEFNANETDDRYMLSTQQSHVFRDNLFLESQFSYLRSKQERLRTDPNAHVTLYTFTPEGTYTTGRYSSDSRRAVDRVRLQETLSWLLTNHSLRFGADIGYLSSEFNQDIGPTRFDFRQLGWPLAYHYYFDPVRYSGSGIEGALYAQDSWQISNRLVFNYGGRAEYQQIIGNTDFSPRLGLAWDVTGDATTKVYANAGRFIERVYDRYLEWGSQPGGDYALVFNPEGDLADGEEIPGGSFGYRIAGDNETPYADAWSVGVEHLLGNDYRIGLSYTDKTLKNQLLTYDVWESDVEEWFEFHADGEGSYKGLDLTFSKRFSKNWEALASYTWSESRGMGSFLGTFYGPTQIPPQNSIEDSDRTNLLKVSGLWKLPFGFLVSGTYRYASGLPYSIQGFDGVGNPIYIGGRNSQRMSAVQSLDMTAQWGVKIASTELTVVAEGFNLTNHENVTAVSTGEVGHGEPTAFDISRTFQLGVKFDF